MNCKKEKIKIKLDDMILALKQETLKLEKMNHYIILNKYLKILARDRFDKTTCCTNL
jgi:hypothetical protein